MHYGKRLKEMMQKKGIRQETLAALLKTRQQNISNWFNTPGLAIDKVELICQGLGMEPYELWLPKDEHTNKMHIPDHLVDFIVFFKNQKPELQDIVMDVTFKLAKIFEKPLVS